MKHQPVRQGQTTTPGTNCPTLFDKCVGSLTSPANHALSFSGKCFEMFPNSFVLIPSESQDQEVW